MTVRRSDPERRDRLIDVTLDLIAENGVAGTSHRRIATRADVPLGSMTYHFDGMDDLLHEAFTRFAGTIIERFEQSLGAATTPDEARAAIVALIHDDLASDGRLRDQVLSYELYTLAARQPRFRAITREWRRRAHRGAVDPPGARPRAAVAGLHGGGGRPHHGAVPVGLTRASCPRLLSRAWRR
jgi:DNA-binding transcriptional regulator YbjK